MWFFLLFLKNVSISSISRCDLSELYVNIPMLLIISIGSFRKSFIPSYGNATLFKKKKEEI